MTKSETVKSAKSAKSAKSVETVETGAGEARITWYAAEGARLVLAVSHGAGGGIEAKDLQALAAELPAHGVTVALVEQPWRVAGKKVAPAPKTLDVGWRGLWPALAEPGLPVIAGGRSAGARVACRTAGELGAAAVLALSFPLHPPGKPEKSRADELLGAGVPTLVVQGGNDPFGKPAEFPDTKNAKSAKSAKSNKNAESGKGSYDLVEIPFADHGFSVPKKADLSQDEAVKLITDAVVEWTAGMVKR